MKKLLILFFAMFVLIQAISCQNDQRTPCQKVCEKIKECPQPPVGYVRSLCEVYERSKQCPPWPSTDAIKEEKFWKCLAKLNCEELKDYQKVLRCALQ